MGYTTDEQALTDKILKYFEELKDRGHPIYWEHRSGQGGFGYKKGAPDFFVVYDGLHIEVEVKGVDGRQSTMQQKFQWKCEQIYHIPYCCPHTWEEFITFITPYIKEEQASQSTYTSRLRSFTK